MVVVDQPHQHTDSKDDLHAVHNLLRACTSEHLYITAKLDDSKQVLYACPFTMTTNLSSSSQGQLQEIVFILGQLMGKLELQ